jgi:type II secretory pathway pseudopilin PulG
MSRAGLRGRPSTAKISMNGERSEFGSHGFAYIGLLVLVAIMGTGLAATGVVFHQQAQREKEKQLLFAGDQIRRAIGLYYESSPGAAKQFPHSLEDLLRDQRYAGTQRYLRRIYVDPMTGSKDWVLLNAPDGGIIGVHSSYSASPLKTDSFPEVYESFKGKQNYKEWKFQYAVPDSLTDSSAAAGTKPLQGTSSGVTAPIPPPVGGKPTRGTSGK